MIKRNNIIDFLPPYLGEYREIQGIVNGENPEFEKLVFDLETVTANQFVVSCDVNGIERFEKMLKLSASGESLEARISKVLINWNDTVPYTFETLVQRLDSVLGVENYKLKTDFNNYQMEIITHFDKYGEVDLMKDLFQFIVPCNIEVLSNNIIDVYAESNLYAGAGIAYAENFEFSDSTKENYSLSISARVTGGIVYCEVKDLSDSARENHIIQCDALCGGKISVTECITTT